MHINQTVWLVHGWTKIAHNPDGKLTENKWLTKCGKTVYRHGRQYGLIIQWDLLNHDKVRLCKHCFPGSC